MTGHRSAVDGFGGGPTLDGVFAVFANYRRRYVLHYLREEERASLGGIARQIAAWERAYRSEEVSGDLADRIEIELVHTHLPRLREADLVQYDRRASLVVYRDPPDIVRALLDLCTDRDLPE
ncbi:DUF7344 domain-containing protein [Haloterrigena alkaliphila]|uniref:ArsR family transcriptional regulator n=1 Tax=Haloterrigena alkaliphila TaxID=2816475 RepID=A0A8A2VJ91_9EURY|nr:ArsR family transcriptional regulator [Haloterrigena alkaliphila]QSX00536.1 ArsR family transcriptional regulator [Haloterrigena alkaliphila]